MFNTAQIVEYIGIGYWGILFISVCWGLLRNDKYLIIQFVLSLAALYYGLKYYPMELQTQGNSNAAGFLFSPIVFVSSYALLRIGYKKIYKFEPDLEAYSNFSNRDKRGLNFLDYVTSITPMVLSIVIGLYLSNQ